MNGRTLSVAVVGAGNILGAHLAALRERPRLKITSVCDPRPEVSSVASELGARWHAEYKEAISEQPDVVIINVPHALHFPVARTALMQHCHVMLEKPVALNMCQINELLWLAEAKQRAFIVADTGYTSQPFRAGRAWVRRGSLGEFVGGHYYNHRYYFQADRPQWFYDPQASGGGQFLNIGVHRLAAVRTILGDEVAEVRVTASVSRPGKTRPIETATTAMVCYDSGAAMHYEEYGYIKPPTETTWSLRLMFENGVMGFSSGRMWTSGVAGEVTEHTFDRRMDDGYGALYDELLRTIDGRPHFPSAVHAVRDTRIALAAYASAQGQCGVDLRDPAWRLHGEGDQRSGRQVN